MSRVHQWVRIQRGIAVYREARDGTWLLDDSRGGGRKRMSLRTSQLSKAISEVERICFPVEIKSIEQLDTMELWIERDQLRAQANKASQPEILRLLEKIDQAVAPRKPVRKAIPLESAIEERVSAILADSNVKNRKYAPQVRGMIRRLGEHAGVANVGDVTAAQIADHINWLKSPRPQGLGLGPKTVINIKSAVKEFFAFCVERKWIEESPAATLKIGKATKGRIRYYTAEEIERVIAFGEREGNFDYAAVFAMICFAGPRLEELHLLPRSAIHLERRKLQIMDFKRSGKLVRVVPILDPLFPILSKYLMAHRNEDKPFHGGRSVDALGQALGRFLRRALPERPTEVFASGRVRAEYAREARRTFCTHLRHLGVSERRVAEWSGHRPEEDSRTYCGVLGDGERAYPLTFLGKSLIAEGIPDPYPEPGMKAN